MDLKVHIDEYIKHISHFKLNISKHSIYLYKHYDQFNSSNLPTNKHFELNISIYNFSLYNNVDNVIRAVLAKLEPLENLPSVMIIQVLQTLRTRQYKLRFRLTTRLTR